MDIEKTVSAGMIWKTGKLGNVWMKYVIYGNLKIKENEDNGKTFKTFQLP